MKAFIRAYKSTYIRIFSVLLAMLLLAGCTGSGGQDTPPATPGSASQANASSSAGDAPASKPEPTPEPQPVEHRIKFSAVGDNLIHNSIYQSAQKANGG